ncbi:OB-fold domain-containing protein [soil metagenome]
MSEPVTITPSPDAPERFLPPESPAGAPFWATTRERRLVLQWCDRCECPIHFPREACPWCLGTDLEFRAASGRGTVYAVTVIPMGGNPGMAGRDPYLVALVDLAEGVRMLTNVIADDPHTVAVGQAVSVAWEPLPDGRHLPVFVADATG